MAARHDGSRRLGAQDLARQLNVSLRVVDRAFSRSQASTINEYCESRGYRSRRQAFLISERFCVVLGTIILIILITLLLGALADLAV
jgi:hypothetical protein